MRALVWFAGWAIVVVLGYVLLPYAAMRVVAELVDARCGGPCDPYANGSAWSLREGAILLWAIWWVALMRPAIVVTLVGTTALTAVMPSGKKEALAPRWRAGILVLVTSILVGPTLLGLGIALLDANR